MLLIGLTGKMRCGKDTFASVFIEQGYERLAFADELKNICMKEYGFTYEQMYVDKEQIYERYGKSPREILQETGDYYRNLDEDFFAKIIEKKIQENKHKKYIITDCRYPNEYRMIKRNGGYIVSILRENFIVNNGHIANKHQSENQEIDYDYRIINDVLEDFLYNASLFYEIFEKLAKLKIYC